MKVIQGVLLDICIYKHIPQIGSFPPLFSLKRPMIRMSNQIKEDIYRQLNKFKDDTNKWLNELKDNFKKNLNEIRKTMQDMK
jgi:hypothetical protein